jgi:hypothetical protein
VTIHGLNVLRLIFFQAILVFHLCWGLWPDGSLPDTLIWNVASKFAWEFCASGFFIVALTCFLIGWRTQSKGRKAIFFAFLLGGWGLFSLLQSAYDLLHGFSTQVWMSWDIYPLLALGLLTAKLADRGRGWLWLGGLGAFLLWIPFWHYEESKVLPLFPWHILIGNCREGYADWPIFPWIGLVWLGFSVGRWWKEKFADEPLRRIEKIEWVAWTMALLASFPFLRTYAFSPIGENWACYVFRQPTYEFWAHLVVFAFCLRISFTPGLQRWLEARPLVSPLGKLCISRRFWLAYLLHYPLLFSVLWGVKSYGLPPGHWALDMAVLFSLPAVEMCTRLAEKAFTLVNKSYVQPDP